MTVQVLKEKLQEEERPRYHSVALRLSLKDETHIAVALESASLQHTSVSMGSYPVSVLASQLLHHPSVLPQLHIPSV